MSVIDDEFRSISLITKEVSQFYKGKIIPSEIAVFICNEGTTGLQPKELIDLQEEHASEIISISLIPWKYFLENFKEDVLEKASFIQTKSKYLYADMENLSEDMIEEMKKFIRYEYGNDVAWKK